MNRNIIMVIVAAVVIGGGYFFLRGQIPQQPRSISSTSQNTNPASPTASSSVGSGQNKSTVMVEYNGNGFNPKSVTIKVGDTVTWTNKNTDKLWVASNPHPVHTDYSGFDALKGIAPGETYSFIFTKAGTWGYHNHLEANKRGEVVVEQ